MIKKIAKTVRNKIKPDGLLLKILAPLYAKFKSYFIPWETALNAIELEITTYCSLDCNNCDRSVRQAPTGEYMSLEQVNKFVQESLDLNWKWERINILGGEPTMHPNFFEIIESIKKYKDKFNDCQVELATNGYGSFVNKVLNQIPDWIIIKNSSKQSSKQNFSSYNIAPIDLKKYRNKDFSRGCWITEKCGLGLNRYGYYCCGAGASVDRVFGFNIGLLSLSMVNRNEIKSQLMKLCQYCGHFKESYQTDIISEDKLSPSWEKAYAEYKKNRTKLSLYLMFGWVAINKLLVISYDTYTVFMDNCEVLFSL
jgi:hypothetical protein